MDLDKNIIDLTVDTPPSSPKHSRPAMDGVEREVVITSNPTFPNDNRIRREYGYEQYRKFLAMTGRKEEGPRTPKQTNSLRKIKHVKTPPVMPLSHVAFSSPSFVAVEESPKPVVKKTLKLFPVIFPLFPLSPEDDITSCCSKSAAESPLVVVDYQGSGEAFDNSVEPRNWTIGLTQYGIMDQTMNEQDEIDDKIYDGHDVDLRL